MADKDFLLGMGERIALKRKEKKLTQEEMAERLGISLQTVSNIECGKKSTRPENIAKICILLDTTADYILLGERTENQIKGITKILASLPEEKYKIVKSLIFILQN